MPNTSTVFKALILAFAAALILTTKYQGGSAPRLAKQAPGEPAERADRAYQVVHGWPVFSEGFVLGHVTGVGVDSHNRVFVFHRADHSIMGKTFAEPISSPVILCFDGRTGALVASWGANRFLVPHGLRVDQDDNIWVTDIGLQQVLKFNHEGELLMAVGEKGVAGLDGKHFHKPTDVAVAPDGSFYVSDGYGNSRVGKFSAKGEFLFDWGHKGDQPGEFDTPHSIVMDREGRIYVADRSNGRIQVFKGDGTFLHQWKSPELGRPWALSFGPDGRLYVVDGGDLKPWPPDRSHILKLDINGNILERWASFGNYDGQLFWGHDIAVGKDGAVYVGDILGRRVQKFAR
jgi:DNA-binding beta-propeller fold protein YncE